MTLFSIITPVYNRNDLRLVRCLESIDRQQCKDYEHIVVDDGSKDGPLDVVSSFPRTKLIKIEHRGRIAARNAGMRAASGDWICWLDSDDAYDPMYLTTLVRYFTTNPECKLWVCGALVQGGNTEGVPTWSKIRAAWKPPMDETGRWVHHHFPSGTVGTGMFVFRRECLDVIGYSPEWDHHEAIADGVDGWLGYETGYSAAKKWVGNPYGDDWVMFRKLTQYFAVDLVNVALYVHYVR